MEREKVTPFACFYLLSAVFLSGVGKTRNPWESFVVRFSSHPMRYCHLKWDGCSPYGMSLQLIPFSKHIIMMLINGFLSRKNGVLRKDADGLERALRNIGATEWRRQKDFS